MKDLTCFSLGNVIKQLNKINVNINLKYNKPFTKPKEQLLSLYEYKNRFVEISHQRYFSISKLICSLINFSFIKSLVADCYSKVGGNCYDPVSLFLLELFCWLDKFKSIKDFCNVLNHKENGNSYRTYAGVSINHIPCPATFSNFKSHIGKDRFNAIFHILITIAQELEMITGTILSHDGTLVPTYARYHGCNYACNDCKDIPIGDFITETKSRILKLLENPPNITLGKEMRSYAKCPRTNVMPEDVKPPSIQVIAFSLVPFIPDYTDNKDQTAKLIGLEDELKKHNLMIKPIRSNISKITLDLKNNPVYVKCPRVPVDLEAKIGYRRAKSNPDKKEKVFGFNVMISTAIDISTGLELPVSCITIPNSEKEENHFTELKSQINEHHNFVTKIDIADAGYDAQYNYDFCHLHNSIPIFDYNPRNEDLSIKTLYQRGYDQNGWPYAPCKAACRPNGFDKQNNRLSFVCSKQCQSIPQAVPCPINDCKHLKNSMGFSTHMTIKEHPRLLSEIPRGSFRWKKIHNLRPSSERTNSAMKENDLNILTKPRIRGFTRFSILAQLASILLLLKRMADFIAWVTVTLRKYLDSHNKKLWKLLELSQLPAYLLSVIQQK